jgi:cytochrome c-type biogenesis protein CcmH/NrfG
LRQTPKAVRLARPGIARAAAQTGDKAKAREAYGKLVTLASADADRPELSEAKAFPVN